MSNDESKAAAVLFSRAMRSYHDGQLAAAAQLLNEVVTACDADDGLGDGTALVAAHSTLYKIYLTMGDEGRAGKHFETAVSLGASSQRLKEV